MTTLADFAKGKDFGGDADSFPEGKTLLDTTQTDVEEVTQEFDGTKKKRYVLKTGDKSYYAGPKVMKGIKKAVEEGATKVEVIKQGKGMETSYVVLPAK